MLKLILTFIFFFIISCSSNDKDELINDQSVYDNNTYQDFELFNKAKKNITNKQFDLALIQLDKIEVLFPNSIYANKGMLLNAYINFLLKDYEKTRAIAENYKKYYPGSADIIYANYLEAMTYFVLIKKSGYSQENANIALNKFTFILNAYPNNKYEIDIITKIDLINNNLANGKIKTAKFYLTQGNNTGALVYLLDIFNNHSSSSSIEETLFYLTKTYYDIDEYDLAKKYASILAYNFPDSNWYQKAYNIVNNLDYMGEDKNWFMLLNPIKILKNNSEKKPSNSEIQSLE